MPEEWPMLAGDPPSSRADTVSGSDDPKSTRKRSGVPAISTGVSLEGWRSYARFWPWPRGRHGTGRGPRGMTAMEVARSMARFSVARRGWQRPRDRGHKGVMPQMVEGGITEVPRREEGGVKRLRVEGNITGSAEEDVAVKRPRLADLDLFGPEEEEWGDTEETSDWPEGKMMSLENLKEPGYPVSEAYSEREPTLMDVPMATEESRPAEGPVEKPEADSEIALAKGGVKKPVAGSTDGLIAMEEPRPAEGVAEKPLAGKTGGEIAMEEPRPAEGVVEYPVAVKTGGATKESRPKESRPQEEALEKPMAGKTDAEIALAKRWRPLRYPGYPSSGKFEDFLKYTDESKRIRELNKAGYDRTKNLPTWRVESDHETKASVKFQERGICLKAGESVVAVSSVGPGHENTAVFCSGVIVSCDEDGVGTVRILTSSGVLYDNDDELRSPEQKVSVKLPNSRKYEGHVLYVNKHYNIAILKVCVGSSMATLSFGSMPRYGQRVIALGRDSKHLFHRNGFISTLERTSLGRTHYMFPKSANGFPVISTGGPVIDEDGAMVGIITCHVPEAAMMSISIVQICLHMWKEYSCIARPEINMNLRTVELLPIDKQDQVCCIYNIQGGFVIDGVEYDSTPEKVGIRKGDIIEIVDETCGSTLPELETYLLLHGLRFLRKMEGLASTKELEMKIRVHNLVERSSTDTQLCIPVVYEVALP